MPEYYVDEQLRWAFSFDNPNKAGAFIAALLPFAWWLCANRFSNVIARWSLRFVGISLLAGGSYMLLRTYSRGAIVALACAGIYLMWRYRARRQGWLLPVGIAALVFAFSAATSVFSQRGSGLGDRSVGNRIELWKGGLAMFAAAPWGLGSGNSGVAYTDWFQPIERTEKYRTMVNSYLTFLVEHGWLISFGILFLATFFWFSLRESTDRLSDAARASLIATAVAGVFSTTLEDWRLWLSVVLSAAMLIVRNRRFRRLGQRRDWTWALGIPCAALLVCFVSGKLLAPAPEVRFRGLDSVLLKPNHAGGRELSFLPDTEVLGEEWAKRIRELSLALGATIHVNKPDGPILIATGDRAKEARKGKRLIFIAPARFEPADLELLAENPAPLVVLNPSFDEDGRARYWKRVAAGDPTRIKIETLSGVGTNVSSDWESAIEMVDRNLRE